MSGTRDWEAGTYDRVSTPQAEWARGVIERLALQGDETVLDAGCGTGRVTEILAARLTQGGSVIAVDGSASMIEEARSRLADSPTSFVHADLLDLDLDVRVDAVFSNAVLHWIIDHCRLFEVLAAVLRPGGRLEAQCGGKGNIAGFYAALREVAARNRYREHLEGFEPVHFAGTEETESLLMAAGFAEVCCRLIDWPVHPPEPREFIRSVCLGAHSERLPADLRESFLEEVLAELGPEPVLAFVRLDISARKPATAA